MRKFACMGRTKPKCERAYRGKVFFFKIGFKSVKFYNLVIFVVFS